MIILLRTSGSTSLQSDGHIGPSGAGIKKFATKVHVVQVGQQNEENKKSEQRVAYISSHIAFFAKPC